MVHDTQPVITQVPDATESMHQHFIIIMQSVTASVKQSSVATNNLIVNPEGNMTLGIVKSNKFLQHLGQEGSGLLHEQGQLNMRPVLLILC